MLIEREKPKGDTGPIQTEVAYIRGVPVPKELAMRVELTPEERIAHMNMINKNI